jgi:hypothetical protein
MDRHATWATQLTRAALNAPPTQVPPVIGRQPTRATRRTPVHPAMDCQAMWDAQPTPVHRAMDTKAARYILPTPVPGMDLPAMVIPVIALRRTGRLEPTTLSAPLAEFRPEIHRQSSTPLVAARTNASVKRIARRNDGRHSIWAVADSSSAP